MTDLVWTLDDGDAAGRWQAPGGGSQTVKSKVIPVTFATSGISTGVGVPLYTLQDGEALSDAAVIITTAWDGTTPLGDIGPSSDDGGFFSTFASGMPNGIDMTAQSEVGNWTGIDTPRAWQSLSALAAISSSGGGSPGNPAMPLLATGVVPLVMWVSQDGTKSGLSPAASQGVATVILTILVPA